MTSPTSRRSSAEFHAARPDAYRYHGEIQGYVHAYHREAEPAHLVVCDMSTHALVICYLSRETSQAAVDLLEDQRAVIFVEGEVTEDPDTGVVTEVLVTGITLAPGFDLAAFENQIGKFPDALTGSVDAAEALDAFRSE